MAAFKKYCDCTPTATVALIQMAELNFARGNAAAATEFASHAIKLQPRSAAAHLLLARAQLQTGNLTRVEAELKVLEAGPNVSDVEALKGDWYTAKGDVTNARHAYERALELRPGSVDALAGLIRIDLDQKKIGDARARAEQQLAKTPDDEALLLLAGKTFLAAGDSKKAEETFRHILVVNAKNIQAYRTLATLYLKERRLDEAKKEYEEISRVNPKAAVAAMTMVGTILTVQQKYDEARKQFELALAMDPQTPVAATTSPGTTRRTIATSTWRCKLAQTDGNPRLPDNAIVERHARLGWIRQEGHGTLRDSSRIHLTGGSDETGAARTPAIRYRSPLA
jgi:tetratricopeptide (TPR) repeat protein